MLGTALAYDPKYYSTNTFLLVRQQVKTGSEHSTELCPVVRFRHLAIMQDSQLSELQANIVAFTRQRFNLAAEGSAIGKKNVLVGNGINIPRYVGSAVSRAQGIKGSFRPKATAINVAVNSPIIRFLVSNVDMTEGTESTSVYTPSLQESL